MELLTVSQLAKATEVGADTVRYYERIGIIGEAERTGAGYRKFDEQAADRIRFIKNAQEMGFSLDEIKELMQLANGGASDCSAISEFARSKVTELDERMRKMRRFKKELEELVDACADGNPLGSCKILAKLNSAEDSP